MLPEVTVSRPHPGVRERKVRIQFDSGSATTYLPVTKVTQPFDDSLRNLAPSVGIAWSPKFGNSSLQRLFGRGDKAVLRSAYSISYVTGGFADFAGIWNLNPGLVQSAGKRSGIDFTPGSPLLRNGIPALTAPPAPTFPAPATQGTGALDFDPHLKTPYVQSWTIALQRELGRDTVFEVRYVGNHALRLGRNLNLNEVNILENGFLRIAGAGELRLEQIADEQYLVGRSYIRFAPLVWTKDPQPLTCGRRLSPITSMNCPSGASALPSISLTPASSWLG